MALHPDIEALSFLTGTWRGNGSGRYPTIEPFRYTEEITFTPGPDKPFLAYSQRTADAETGRPLHAETGYLRGDGSGTVELVIAQPTGICEILVGAVEGTALTLSGTVFLTPTAKDVRATRREIRVDGGILAYRLAMAAVGHPLQHHLDAELTRVAG